MVDTFFHCVFYNAISLKLHITYNKNIFQKLDCQLIHFLLILESPVIRENVNIVKVIVKCVSLKNIFQPCTTFRLKKCNDMNYKSYKVYNNLRLLNNLLP